MTGLSVLIPTFNDECLSLVRTLQSQCEALTGGIAGYGALRYEIIVADDGSTDAGVRERNSAVALLPHCTYMAREANVGRAAIRNLLARKASFDRLLFIDSDMTVVRKDYIYNYVRERGGGCVVYGGYDVPLQRAMEHNLRYRYERACRHAHTTEKRRQNPYLDFHTSNFMIPKRMMMEHPLDEHFRHYGYEDVAFGRELQRAGIEIRHIDNPMGFCRFEDNENFLRKTEESIRTLAEFSGQLHNYSRLLQLAGKIDRYHLSGLARIMLKPAAKPLRKALVGQDAPIAFLNLYKLILLLEIEKHTV